MTLADLIRWGTGLLPEADETVLPSISTTQLSKRDITNEAASEFVKLTRCFPRNKKFDCTGSNYTYSISTEVSDFGEMAEEGMWHLRSDTTSNASTVTWERLEAITVRDLDEKFRTWRNQSASDMVRYYWQEGNELGVFYTPSNSVSDGFWIYYYAISSDMSSLTDYPFTGTTTRDTRLATYEKDLLTYYQAKVLGLLGYKDDAQVKLTEFYALCTKARGELQSRRDIAQSSRARPKTRMGLGNPFRS